MKELQVLNSKGTKVYKTFTANTVTDLYYDILQQEYCSDEFCDYLGQDFNTMLAQTILEYSDKTNSIEFFRNPDVITILALEKDYLTYNLAEAILMEDYNEIEGNALKHIFEQNSEIAENILKYMPVSYDNIKYNSEK